MWVIAFLFNAFKGHWLYILFYEYRKKNIGPCHGDGVCLTRVYFNFLSAIFVNESCGLPLYMMKRNWFRC
jgi:hypothetical protein